MFYDELKDLVPQEVWDVFTQEGYELMAFSVIEKNLHTYESAIDFWAHVDLIYDTQIRCAAICVDMEPVANDSSQVLLSCPLTYQRAKARGLSLCKAAG